MARYDVESGFQPKRQQTDRHKRRDLASIVAAVINPRPTRRAIARSIAMTIHCDERQNDEFVVEALGQFVAYALITFLARRFRNAQRFANLRMRLVVEGETRKNFQLFGFDIFDDIRDLTPRLLPLNTPLGRRFRCFVFVDVITIFGKTRAVALHITHVVAKHMVNDAERPRAKSAAFLVIGVNARENLRNRGLRKVIHIRGFHTEVATFGEDMPNNVLAQGGDVEGRDRGGRDLVHADMILPEGDRSGQKFFGKILAVEGVHP